MYNQQPECLNTGTPSLDHGHIVVDYDHHQEPAGSDSRSSLHEIPTTSATEWSRRKSAYPDVPENLKVNEIFRKYNRRFIESALALFRDHGDVLRPFLRLSHVEKVNISSIVRNHPNELGAILDISAEDGSFIERFSKYNDTGIQDIFSQLDSHNGTLQDPLPSHNKRLQIYSQSTQQPLGSRSALPVSSNFSTPMLPSSIETLTNAGRGDLLPTYCCTYFCGNTFQKEGHRNKHELNHHNGKRKITCQHDGCEVKVDTEPAYVVHHNKKHKLCKAVTSCGHSGEYVRPPKTASSCGYCGKLFQGESNFTARGGHITREHHKPKDPKRCKTTEDWSRNIQLEGKNGMEGMFSRHELVGWISFKEKRIGPHAVSKLCWKGVAQEEWERLLELLEYGAVIDDGPQWGFSDSVVQNIFEEAFNLALPQPSRLIPQECLERITNPDVESTTYNLDSEMSEGVATLEPFLPGLHGHVGDDPSSTSNQHQWMPLRDEGPCAYCKADGSTYYGCTECGYCGCGICCGYLEHFVPCKPWAGMSLHEPVRAARTS